MKISEILSENNQRIDLKLSTIFDKIHECLEDWELTDSDVFVDILPQLKQWDSYYQTLMPERKNVKS